MCSYLVKKRNKPSMKYALVAAVLLSVTGLGCLRTNNLTVSPTITTTPIENISEVRGTSFTALEAGIKEMPNAKDLAYLKEIIVKDGKTYISIDPVRFTDCRGLINKKLPVPAACKQLAGVETGFLVEDSHTTTTLELTNNAGPYFLAAMNSGANGKVWRTMDIDSIQKNLSGKLPLETLIDAYYDPDLHTTPGLFYVE